MSSVCNARISAQAKSDALCGRAFLEHGAGGGNGFLIQACVAIEDQSCAQVSIRIAPRRDDMARPRLRASITLDPRL
jgi:hypothetical protein